MIGSELDYVKVLCALCIGVSFVVFSANRRVLLCVKLSVKKMWSRSNLSFCIC